MIQLNIQFRIKDPRTTAHFLGMQTQFHQEDLFMSQQKYAKELLTLASISDCAPMLTPLLLQLNKSLE